jgi:hypothetical protein
MLARELRLLFGRTVGITASGGWAGTQPGLDVVRPNSIGAASAQAVGAEPAVSNRAEHGLGAYLAELGYVDRS